jgi:hypothetical protein
MTKEREALPVNCGTGHCSCVECLMKTEQEPVAWMHTHSNQIFVTQKPNKFDLHLFTPLYMKRKE